MGTGDQECGAAKEESEAGVAGAGDEAVSLVVALERDFGRQDPMCRSMSTT